MPDAGASPVVVVGGGWAGLAAAITLARHDIPVTLMESARHLGGRARSVPFNDLEVDNGQHLMIGAYRHMRELIKTLGIDETSLFARKPLRLLLRSVTQAQDLELSTPHAPAPLHIAAALVTARGLTPHDKWHALRFCGSLSLRNFCVDTDLSVSDLLQRHRQTDRAIQRLWNPLCIGALNTPPHMASAQLFVHVLKQSFTGKRCFSDLLIPRVPLGKLLPQPASDYLKHKGAGIRLGQRVQCIETENNRIAAIHTDNERITTGELILALPPLQTSRLISAIPQLQPLRENLQQFSYDSICTVYLQYPPEVHLDVEMMGVYDGISQWIFDRRICNQPGLMAVVISATSQYQALDNRQLATRVKQELACLFPHWPAPLCEMVIHEKHATFSGNVRINSIRPDYNTAVAGIWLAGDYTNTGLPATLEGAVQSGVQCAHKVIDHINRSGLAQ